jgi:hypothetical protein
LALFSIPKDELSVADHKKRGFARRKELEFPEYRRWTSLPDVDDGIGVEKIPRAQRLSRT